MKIEKAQVEDAIAITDLTIKSKAYWGYSEALIDSWREELKISGQYILDNTVIKLTDENQLVGFYALGHENEETCKINFFFMDPKFIGKGYGKILIKECIERVTEAGYKRAVVDADPNAELFYSKYGFNVIDKIPSSVPGRYLPFMERLIS